MQKRGDREGAGGRGRGAETKWAERKKRGRERMAERGSDGGRWAWQRGAENCRVWQRVCGSEREWHRKSMAQNLPKCLLLSLVEHGVMGKGVRG